jgi:hypothetical protein
MPLMMPLLMQQGYDVGIYHQHGDIGFFIEIEVGGSDRCDRTSDAKMVGGVVNLPAFTPRPEYRS